MSLDKAILYGKEKRKPYYHSKRFDPSCRNHGDCPWCTQNRKYKFRDKHPLEKGEIEEMRDINRIDDFCQRLAAAWKNKHDWRFGQLIENIKRFSLNTNDIFYIEDDKMIKEIEDFLRHSD